MIRFLLLTDPRSGTMMLTDTLSKHSQIKWFNLYASNPDNPRGHYKKLIDLQEDKSHKWTGTTMHRVGDGWINSFSHIPPNKFWKEIYHRHDRWILLHRENILRQWISRQVGVILRSYKVSKPRSVDPGPIRIVIQEFMSYVAEMEGLRQKIDVNFLGALVLTYEELCDDWKENFLLIQKYLGLNPIITEPVTFKQESRPLHEVIENYEEIKSYLSNRGYGRWFE